MAKVITQYICPPIPVRGADWVAYIDGTEEDGVRGFGKTEKDALHDLFFELAGAPGSTEDLVAVLERITA